MNVDDDEEEVAVMPAPDRMPDYAVGPLLQRAHRRAADTFNDALRDLGLEGRHFGVLMTLERLGPMSQARLAERLGADKSAMVRMIDHLESRGWVERSADPTDRRVAAVTMTASGGKVFLRARKVAESAADELLRGFDGDERAQFTRLLGRFVGIATGPSVPLPGAG